MTRSCVEDLTGKADQDSRDSMDLLIYPKTKVCLSTVYYIMPLTTLLTLTGGYPRPPFSEEDQLRALVNKSPGHERSISIQHLCWHFSLLDSFIHTLATNAHDCSPLPNHERHGKPKNSKSPNGHRAL